MRGTVLIFARAPRLGTLKKRLARDIGALAALQFYRRSLDRLTREIACDPAWRTVWVVTPDIEAGRQFTARGGRVIPQGMGNLGQRMARALRSVDQGPAVIIGTDIPEIDRHAINAAFSSLKNNDAVFGPSEDGGYWIVGLSGRRPVPYGLFKKVRWSSEHALADSLASLPSNYAVGFAPVLDDIDTGEDFFRWKERSRDTC